MFRLPVQYLSVDDSVLHGTDAVAVRERIAAVPHDGEFV